LAILIFYTVLSVFAVWRLTHLFSKEDGPFDVIYKLRKQLGQGFFGSLLDCFYCLSIWISLPFGLWLGKNGIEKVLLWLAVSGAACLLQKATEKTDAAPPEFYEDKE
jgi:hypothetical protein